MRCPRCKGELTVPELYCPLCGIRYAGCAYCHELIDAKERFCPSCGRPVARSYSFDDMDNEVAENFGADRLSRLEIGDDTPVTPAIDERYTVKALSEKYGKSAPQPERAYAPKEPNNARSALERSKGLLPRKDSPWEPSGWWYWWFPWPWWGPWGYSYYYHPAFYLLRIVATLITLAFFFIYIYPQFIAFRAESHPEVFPSWMLAWPFLVLAGAVLVAIIYGIFTWLMYRARKRR